VTATSVVVFTEMPQIQMGPMPQWAVRLFETNFNRQTDLSENWFFTVYDQSVMSGQAIMTTGQNTFSTMMDMFQLLTYIGLSQPWLFYD